MKCTNNSDLNSDNNNKENDTYEKRVKNSFANLDIQAMERCPSMEYPKSSIECISKDFMTSNEFDYQGYSKETNATLNLNASSEKNDAM